MGTLTWIIIMIVVFWIVSSVANQFKKQTSQNQQSTRGNDTATVRRGHDLGEMQASREQPRARNATGDSGSRGSVSDTVVTTDGEEQTETYNVENAGAPYAKSETTPYERDDKVPYHREQQRPYQQNANGNHIPDFSYLSKEQWTQGIILSEVLGPPRARRPHQSGRITHR